MTNASSPVRYPNTRSPEVMTRRAWVLVVLNILIPGSAQLLAGSRRLGRFGVGSTFVLWGLIAIGALVYFLGRTAFITIATNSFALWVLQGVIIFYVVLWVVLTLDTLRLVRFVNVEGNARIFIAVLSVAALVVDRKSVV